MLGLWSLHDQIFSEMLFLKLQHNSYLAYYGWNGYQSAKHRYISRHYLKNNKNSH